VCRNVSSFCGSFVENMRQNAQICASGKTLHTSASVQGRHETRVVALVRDLLLAADGPLDDLGESRQVRVILDLPHVEVRRLETVHRDQTHRVVTDPCLHRNCGTSCRRNNNNYQ